MPHIAKHINGLPYQAVNYLLPLRLEHAVVHLSDKTIQHICERHPNDYELCLTHIEIAVSKPDYIGQEPHHPENFEVVRIVGDAMVLVAISSIAD
jgi:hypothetical protein